jgi:GH25 family lysozyme M1 (1,4-beta-N-acetylmuramidase)
MPRRTSIVRIVTAVALAAAVATPIVTGTVAGAATVKIISGPDVSHYQHPSGKAINWVKVAKAGKTFAISKATEGTTYTDPYFATDYPAELAAGLVHGSYHFAHPALPINSTALAQAKFFSATVGPVNIADTLPPALDLEQTGGLDPAQLVTWAQDFLLDLRTLTGRTPMLYTYPNFWDNDLADASALSRYPLWMAEFGTSTAPVADLWQYTDDAHIKGIPDGTDESKFLGTTGQPWATLSNGTVATKWASAAPAAPVRLGATVDGTSVTVSWLPGDAGTSRVTGYTVTSSPGHEVQTVAGGTFNTTFANLSTTKTYTFTVTATNAVGTSAASLPSPPVTPTIPTVLNATIPASLTYGAVAPLQATLLRADTHAALAGRQVLIFRRSSPTKPWRQIRKLSTDTAGLASSSLRPTRSAELEAVFPGAKGVARSSIFENYRVSPTVTAALSATAVTSGTHLRLTGSVTPFAARTQVVREQHVNGVWRVIAGGVLGHKGRFDFAIHPKATGVDVFRVVVAAAKGRARGHSAPLRLTVS